MCVQLCLASVRRLSLLQVWLGTHTHTRTHTHIHTQTHIHTHAHTHTQTHIHTHAHTVSHKYICTHLRTSAHTHTHTLTHTHAHTYLQVCGASPVRPPGLLQRLQPHHPPHFCALPRLRPNSSTGTVCRYVCVCECVFACMCVNIFVCYLRGFQVSVCSCMCV
jgi:hypothetical protein